MRIYRKVFTEKVNIAVGTCAAESSSFDNKFNTEREDRFNNIIGNIRIPFP